MGDIEVTDTLTPYDTGKRAEPKVWYRGQWTDEDLASMSPIERELEEDRFGKVDFDDNASETIVTAWIEKTDAGEHVMHVQGFVDMPLIKVHL